MSNIDYITMDMTGNIVERLALLEARLALLESSTEPLLANVDPPKKRGSKKTSPNAPVPISSSSRERSGGSNFVAIVDFADIEREDFLRVAYRRLLRKEVDSAGMDYYLGELERGRSKADILKHLSNEPEAIAAGIILTD